MLFLVDECTGPAVAKWLRAEGHEVFSVFDEAKGIKDEDVLHIARNEGRTLITNDKDFGEMIFRERLEHCGVIFLRLSDERSANKIRVLQHILQNYSDRLAGRFVTATESKIRLA